MLRVAIVDSKVAARRNLRQLLASLDGVEICGEASSLQAAEGLLADNRIDVVFLDVEMPEGFAFSWAESLPCQVKVIVITAESDQAWRGFEIGVVDYVIKPVRMERLKLAVSRVTADPSLAKLPLAAPSPCLLIREADRERLIDPARVCAVEAEGDYTAIYLDGAERVMMLRSLKSYEEELDEKRFVRLHRSLIVNRERIESVQIKSRDEGFLKLVGKKEPFLLRRAALKKVKALMAS